MLWMANLFPSVLSNSLEGIGHIGFPCWLDISCIHIATQFKGTSRIGLHGFYKFVEIVVDITFMCFWFRNIVDIVLTKLVDLQSVGSDQELWLLL